MLDLLIGNCRIFWLAAVLVLCSCTEATLSQLVPFSRHGFTGTVAAPPPLKEVPPTFILYVADISYSTIISDPNGLRQQIFANLVNNYRNANNVYYGIMTFSDAAYVQTLNFTNDFNLLLSASTNLNNNLDGGNFSDTLFNVFEFLDRSVKNQSAQQAQLSQYYVYFISTGIPNVGLSDPNSIFPFVQGITAAMVPRVRHFELDTAFLSYIPTTAPPTVQAAYALSAATLSGMAEAGQGRYEVLELVPPATANIGINLDPIDREFSLQQVYVTNINTAWDAGGPAVDSDADALADSDEETLGTNVANPDTDGDGYRDGIEAHFPNTLNPLVVNAGCINPNVDSDQDHLMDCEEALYGTSVINPDSNGNFILDGDEVLQGASPTSTLATRDIDQDGYTDEQEILAHTAVTRTHAGKHHAEFRLYLRAHHHRSQRCAAADDRAQCEQHIAQSNGGRGEHPRGHQHHSPGDGFCPRRRRRTRAVLRGHPAGWFFLCERLRQRRFCVGLHGTEPARAALGPVGTI